MLTFRSVMDQIGMVQECLVTGIEIPIADAVHHGLVIFPDLLQVAVIRVEIKPDGLVSLPLGLQQVMYEGIFQPREDCQMKLLVFFMGDLDGSALKLAPSPGDYVL